MHDPHLNLFYSYNHDNELIENNLTRAWIVTMRLLSPPARGRLLAAVLGEAHGRNPLAGEPPPGLEHAEFALQGHMKKSLCRALRGKYVLAIASERYEESEPKETAAHDETYASVPDAWIYDRDRWVYLVEAKVGAYPLRDQQLRGHAKAWLGLAGKEELQAHLLSLSWFDVLAAIEELREGGPLADYEHRLLAELVEYLGWFGYHLFEGFRWDKLQHAPGFQIAVLSKRPTDLPGFDRLSEPPRFRINVV